VILREALERFGPVATHEADLTHIPADMRPENEVPHGSALQEKQPRGMLESPGPLISKSNSRTLQHSIG
jgi:hypothetical protein